MYACVIVNWNSVQKVVYSLAQALAAAGAAAAAGLAVLLATSAAVVTGSARPDYKASLNAILHSSR